MTKEKLIEELQTEFSNEFTGIGFNFSQYIQDNVEEGLSGVKGANSVKIIGPDLVKLEELAAEVLHEMDQINGVSDLGIFRVLGQPNLNITIDRAKTARYGLNAGDVNNVVQAALGGTVATTVLEADRQFGVNVRLAPQFRDQLASAAKIKVGVPNNTGGNAYIPLSELAEITLDTGASYIFHERNQRFIPIKFSVRGRDLGGAVRDAQDRVARRVEMPGGYRVEWVGEFGNLEEALRRLGVVVPLSICLIALLLYFNFGSLRDTLLAASVIPMALIGGVFALYLTGTAFSVSAAIGFVALFGIAAMDGIIVLAYFNGLVDSGVERMQAILRTGEVQMRPVVMTCIAACAGLLPAAVSTGIGAQVQRPLAIVVVGGMILAPVLILIVLPVAIEQLSRHQRSGSAGAAQSHAAE
jgi:cobalt-zinc-cadmium resistance protein CzcA